MFLKKVNVFKDPITDSGKRSKKGRLMLEKIGDDNYVTREEILMSTANSPKHSSQVRHHRSFSVYQFI